MRRDDAPEEDFDGVWDSDRFPAEELNARLLAPLVHYVEDSYGRVAAARVARTGGMDPRDVRGGRCWISHDAFERVLRAGRALMRTDEEFRIACQYRLVDSYGPLRFLVRASSVSKVLSNAARTMHLLSRISRYEILEVSARHIRSRYLSERAESRLMCLSRQAQIEAFTSLWRLPRARVEESACIARGDPYCEYHVSFYEHPRLRGALLGAGGGLGVAGLLALLGVGGPVAWALMPVLGSVAGHMVELRAVYRRNVAYAEEANEIARDMAQRHEEALLEVRALEQRHRQWSRLLEQQIAERQVEAEKMVTRLEALLTERTFEARSLSHDMRTPLTVFKNAPFILRKYLRDDDEVIQLLRELDRTADQVTRMLEEFLESTRHTGREMISLRTERLPIRPLVDRIRRQMLALLLGKPVQVSVFATREAPENIEVDPLVFNRILDNLLTNAARYTEAGHIAVELEGTPEWLTVKISDTGPGIAAQDIKRVFLPGETAAPAALPNSFGVGLPTVVRLLYQIGGRLEVMSRPSMGTTFWVHLPVRDRSRSAEGRERAAGTLAQIIDHVVTVRPAND